MNKLLAMVMALALSATCVLAQQPQLPGGPPEGPAGAPRPGFGAGGMMGGGAFGAGAGAVLAPPSAAMLQRVEGLALTDAQWTQLEGILQEGQRTLQPLRQKVTEASAPLRAALADPTFSQNKVQQLAKALQDAEAAVVAAEIRIWTQVRGVLSGAQVKMIQDSMAPRVRQPREGMPGDPGAPPRLRNRQSPAPAPQ